MLRRAVPCLLVLALAALPCAAKDRVEDLVVVREGNMPIILTAPHGGITAIPGVAAREQEGRGARYVFTVDFGSDQLALGIADELRRLTGKAPYVVVARFDRKYIDANRPPDVAYDDPKARPYHEHYHGTIRRFVDEVRARYPAGVLLDVHGQTQMRDALMRGTSNGRTVARLVARAGNDAITGPKGLFGQLESSGFRVFPSNSLPPSGKHEDAGLPGGYTTYRYGSANADGIDAIQLEFGADYRTARMVDASARKAARAIAAFYEAYLK